MVDSPYDRCIRNLDDALKILDRPLSKKMYRDGWTDEKLANIRSLVFAWRHDFEEDGKIRVRHHRIMNRWFLDAGVSFRSVEDLLSDVDDTVYKALGLP